MVSWDRRRRGCSRGRGTGATQTTTASSTSSGRRAPPRRAAHGRQSRVQPSASGRARVRRRRRARGRPRRPRDTAAMHASFGCRCGAVGVAVDGGHVALAPAGPGAGRARRSALLWSFLSPTGSILASGGAPPAGRGARRVVQRRSTGSFWRGLGPAWPLRRFRLARQLPRPPHLPPQRDTRAGHQVRPYEEGVEQYADRDHEARARPVARAPCSSAPRRSRRGRARRRR